jgi:choline kinase
MRAVIYAAGVGKRLAGAARGLPKVLLRFGGHSLLERHVRLLGACGVDQVVVCAGFRAEAIAAELDRLDAGRVGVVHNPDYEAGSIVTQWAAREAICAGGPVLIMDADVLYDQRLLARLIDSPHADCFLLDRAIEPGEEPVKLCVRDGHLVDFRKNPERPCDWFGESVGFFKLAGATARRLVEATRRTIEGGRTGEDYEEALRALLLADPPGRFGFEDVTGLPWLEIDFAADVDRARREVLPRLEPLPAPAEDPGR